MATSKSGARSTERKSGSSNGSEPRPGSTRKRSKAESVKGDASNSQEVAGTAKGPAMVLGAVAVGLAGLALKRRRRRTKVLGVSLPSSSELDVRSLAKTLGQASKQFAKTSKKVSKDIERVGSQAERIAKILD